MRTGNNYFKKIKVIALLLCACCLPVSIYAGTDVSTNSFAESLNNPSSYLLVFLVVILLATIIGLTRIITSLSKGILSANKKSSATILLILISVSAFAQTQPVERSATQLPDWAMNSNLYLFGFLFLIMVITIYVLLKANMQLIKVLSPKPEAVEWKEEVVEQAEPSFFRKIYLRLVDSVPVAEEKDVMLDHDYDGIKELDNNLPPWWKYGFYLTIVFGIIYLINYHVIGNGEVQLTEYKAELKIAAQEKEERMKVNAENVNEANVVLLNEPAEINLGKETFQKLCAACHRTDGGGQVGPNLTDEFWLHGGGIKNVFTVITEGVPSKGMISWKNQLSPKQIQQVASYILTLKGTNPAGPKEPQGDKWVEEKTTPVDSIIKAATSKPMAANKTSEIK